MAYQVIARKWRPQTFEEVTGQEAITRTLRNAIEHNRLHHAYLLSGARGVGKTTTARLLAKALNCHKTSKPNPAPCSPNQPDACASCIEIAEARSIDVLEIDAASNTGVDNVREVIINNLGISPARDRYKVFIIDEVHMLSTSSFNALLKSIEEPPPQVVFIMATTELHKVPDTILSRCQEFEFRTIAVAKIFERLKLIADAEKINVSESSLREIARSGNGSMRDAQSNFDQVVSFSGERIEVQDVMNALGMASSEMLSRVVDAIAAKNAVDVLRVVADLIARGQNLRNFSHDLMAHFRDLLVAKLAPEADELFDSAVLSGAELSKQTQNFTEADLIRFFNSLSDTESKLRDATEPRYALEIGLVKLIEMRRVEPLEKILERLANLENAFSGKSLPPSNTSIEISKSFESANSAEALSEKKTLKFDFSPAEVSFPTSLHTVCEISLKPEVEAIKASPVLEQTNLSVSSKTLAPPDADSFFIKLLPLSAEDLEHVEDNWLDSAYEDKLLRAGDALSIIAAASALVEKALSPGGNFNFADAKIEAPAANGAAAFAPAKTSAKPIPIAPVFEHKEISNEMPVMPENPTDEDLRRYAENHPKVKLALRIFRGKIISVSQNK